MKGDLHLARGCPAYPLGKIVCRQPKDRHCSGERACKVEFDLRIFFRNGGWRLPQHQAGGQEEKLFF
ncbi:hypothetical protein QW131_17790 [Roseibium salinum]|nr:hypothetical protein [Roseibium salinum]